MTPENDISMADFKDVTKKKMNLNRHANMSRNNNNQNGKEFILTKQILLLIQELAFSVFPVLHSNIPSRLFVIHIPFDE